MITIGIDPHKRTHTAVAVSGVGELLDELTIPAEDDGHRQLIAWAEDLARDDSHRFALEDCRGVNGRLERFLLEAGEHVLRVPPKLMANARKGGREVGKSDPIDALAVARAALREESKLHPASTDSRARELKVLVDHREALVHDRSIYSTRLRWYLHDIDPELEPAARTFDRPAVRRSIAQRLARLEQTAQVRVCRDLLARIGEITRCERELAAEIGELAESYAPGLFEIPGVARLTAGKLIGEIGGIDRFRTDAKLARHAGCAPIPASSGNTQRLRFDRNGNRQLNATFYRIALTQIRVHPEARAYLARKRAEGKTTKEALRCLKRHLVRTVWRAMQPPSSPTAFPALS